MSILEAKEIRLIKSLTDESVNGFIFMSSSKSILCIITAYLALIYFGKKLMVNRPSFKLHFLLIVYDLSVASFSFYIVFQLLVANAHLKYNLFCEPVHYDVTDEWEIMIIKAGHNFLLCKTIELLDTLFYILRKKQNQLLTAHYFHHISMVVGAWLITGWSTPGSAMYVGLINCFIHFILYLNHAMVVLQFKSINNSKWKMFLFILTSFQTWFVVIQSSIAILAGCPANGAAIYFLWCSGFILLCLYTINIWRENSFKNLSDFTNYAFKAWGY